MDKEELLTELNERLEDAREYLSLATTDEEIDYNSGRIDTYEVIISLITNMK